ncbi:hypothetical protein VaNZ11_012008 [Volvox africanus]|uniref:SET domain-containing protein n=1 Tax=Volvox africanus TaxID=51714 RepID=A0ABQ5SCX4_9CHLO|nr:hypothetical protein VaNZ11_012008 [Volvox africanus]
MHIIRNHRASHSVVDTAPPGTPTGAPGWPIARVGTPLSYATVHRLLASKQSASTSDPGNASDLQTRSSAPSWGAALASKARKNSGAAGLRRQHQHQQNQTLETVEAVAVTSDDLTGSHRDAATPDGGPVVVVHPQNPLPQSPSASGSPSAVSRRASNRVGPSGSSSAPPAVTFVRPPGLAGRSAASGIGPSPRSNKAVQGGEPSRDTSSSGIEGVSSKLPRDFTSVDPITSARGPPRPSSAVTAWLGASGNKKASGNVTVPGSSSMASARSPTRSSSPTFSSSGRATSHTPRATTHPANIVATAGAAAAATMASFASGTGPKVNQDGSLPQSVSFSQVMGRQKRPTGSDQNQKSGQDSDEAEGNLVDYTWEPDPDLDVIEADAAAEAEARRRDQEQHRDLARERRELLEAAEAAVQRSYSPGTPLPMPFIGSVKVQRLPGRGYGLVADEDIAAGQLLLVSLPVLCEMGSAGELPPLQPLVAKALRLLRLADGVPSPSPGAGGAAAASTSTSFSGQTQTEAEIGAGAVADGLALGSLYWGAPRSASARPSVDLVSWRGQQQDLLSTPRARLPATAAKARAGDSSRGTGAVVWTQPRVMSLLQFNLLAEGTQDGAATIARSGPLMSVAGIWPEVALINHSCAPNAATVLLQDRLVVRATRRIPQGREVLLNWLGSPGALAPFQERREQLSEMYQFACRCARCQMESSESLSLPFLYSDAERESEEALEVIEEALQVRDLGSLTLALQPLQAAVLQLSSSVQLLGEQVDLTSGREGAMMAAAMGGSGLASTAGEEDKDWAGGGSALAPAAAKKRRAGGKGTALTQQRTAIHELGPVNRATAEAWLLGGMLPLNEALLKALAYRAVWLGMDLGPGWHWPPEPPVAVPASSMGATAPVGGDAGAGVKKVVVGDSDFEEQQADAVAELIGSLASYVDVVAQLLPGSEIHTQAAARLLSLSRRFLGPMDRVAGDIDTAAYDAYVLRYGKLDAANFERLVAAGIAALDAARKREAGTVESQQARQPDRLEEGETEQADDEAAEVMGLESLFLEDQRLRDEHAAAAARAAAAMAAAAAQTPRSYPLQGRRVPVPPPPPKAVVPLKPLKNRGKTVGVAALAPVVGEEVDEDSNVKLPEGVGVRSTHETGGGSISSKGRRHSVMAEAEQDLIKILGSNSKPKAQPSASRESQTAQYVAGDDDDNEEEVATVRRLFRRDTTPRVRGATDEEEEAGGNMQTVKAPDLEAPVQPSMILPQQKFEKSLDALLNVFPGLGTSPNGDRDGGISRH